MNNNVEKNNNLPNKQNANNQNIQNKLQILFQQQQQMKQKLGKLQQEQAPKGKYNIQPYLNDNVIHQISIFLNTKEIANLRLVNKKFNESFDKNLPKLVELAQQQVMALTEFIELQYYKTQIPVLDEVHFEDFADQLDQEHLYKSPEKQLQLYIDCFDLIFRVINFDMPQWKMKKITYQMKVQAILDQFKKNPKLLDIYKFNDQQIQVIKSESSKINFGQRISLKCEFTPLLNFCENLQSVAKFEDYKKLEEAIRNNDNLRMYKLFIDNYQQYV